LWKTQNNFALFVVAHAWRMRRALCRAAVATAIALVIIVLFVVDKLQPKPPTILYSALERLRTENGMDFVVKQVLKVINCKALCKLYNSTCGNRS